MATLTESPPSTGRSSVSATRNSSVTGRRARLHRPPSRRHESATSVQPSPRFGSSTDGGSVPAGGSSSGPVMAGGGAPKTTVTASRPGAASATSPSKTARRSMLKPLAPAVSADSTT